ncbi:Bug family tripartite tricarboxylate transporter substrate binding protein [Ramlibacter sp.]|uniref:Bug family tripartite tricarboxylate transporter substrate binding protein n=1 Tax=Ramlibacter sp. TaxID=1917967 RepID=UPI003D0F2F60
MRHLRHAFTVAAALVAALVAVPAAADYPDRPVKIIIPHAPGGGTDVVGRLMAERLTNVLKQSFVAENKPGAGAMIGAQFVASAPPDGYTLLMGTSAELTIGPNMVKSQRYDPVKDFQPVALVGYSPNVILAASSFAPKNVKELGEFARANPDKLFYSSGGAGTSPHVSGELLKTLGIPMTHVPFNGTGPAMSAFLSGQMPLIFSTMAPAVPLIKDGRARALAVTSAKRSPLLPDVPTVAEQGLTGYEAVTWYAFMAPAGTPRDVVEKLRGAVAQILATKEMGDRLERMGIVGDDGTASEAIRARIGKELAMWGNVIKQNNIKFE